MKLLVLSVDDDGGVIAKYLEALGHRAELSRSSIDASARLAESDAGVVLISAAQAPTPELIAGLRRARKERPLWVLATTTSDHVDAALAAGADDCVVAPVAASELERRLRVAERALGMQSDSLELNREIMEVIPGGIVHVRADGSIVSANAEALRLLGLSYDELTRRYVTDFETETVHEDGSPCLPEHYPVSQALFTGQKQPPHTIGVRRPDGETSWAIFTAVPLFHAQSGALSGAVVTFLDITQRKRTERELAESEARHRELVEGVPDPVGIVAGGVLLFINPAGAALLGYESAEQLRGRPITDLIPLARRDALESYLRLRQSRVPLSPVEETLLRRDGSTVAVEIAVMPFAWQGQPALVFVARDLTMRKQAEERLREIETQLRHTQKLESLGVLAGGIAHDFNNLLAVILGNSNLARQQLGPDSPVRPHLEAIETSAERAADLAAQMLAYSGRGKLDVRPISLSDVVREMLELLTSVISKKATLSYELDPTLPLIDADRSQLQQVVMNLIVNASDALAGQPGVIRVKTSRRHATRETLSRTYVDEGLEEGAYVVLEVTDSGHGMDAATRARVFDPFFTTKTTGRGLGLALTLGIVRGHRGAIELESEPGRGTTFRAFFPATEARRAEPPALAATPRPTRSAGLVLVVDDEPLVRDVTCQMLERYGFRVMSADGGKSGLELFERHLAEIDAVVLDMTMPDMNGNEVLTELRRQKSDVAVLLCSGYSESDVFARIDGDTRCAFLQKPYTITALIDKVQQVLGARASAVD